jgi:glycosyltransferase involved in cell wall biosynthesis
MFLLQRKLIRTIVILILLSEIKISVIITAYNRTEFVLSALNSVIHQTIDDSMYEIILVTNFKVNDLVIPSEKNFKIIKTDGSIGLFYKKAISISAGKILCFLDDDDTYEPTKLEEVYDLFSRHNLDYLRDYPEFINSKGKKTIGLFQPLKKLPLRITACDFNDKNIKNVLKYKLFFNISTVSISKSVILPTLDRLDKLTAATDQFFFFLYLYNGVNMLFSNNHLTNYRVHESTSFSSKMNKSSSAKLCYDWTNAEITFSFIEDIFPLTQPNGLIHLKHLHIKGMSFLAGNDCNYLSLSELVLLSKSYFSTYGSYKFGFLLLMFLSFFSKKFSRFFYTASSMKISIFHF